VRTSRRREEKALSSIGFVASRRISRPRNVTRLPREQKVAPPGVKDEVRQGHKQGSRIAVGASCHLYQSDRLRAVTQVQHGSAFQAPHPRLPLRERRLIARPALVGPDPLVPELRAQISLLEMRLKTTQDELLAMAQKVGATETELVALRARAMEIREDRDAWRQQAERLARPWWRRLAG
jgi:hypothetical protein